MRKRIYVAGPITKGNYPQNIRNAIDAGTKLLSLGYSPFIPHLNFILEMIHPISVEQLLEWDKDWLAVCDAVLRLPGESQGADIEEMFAIEQDIPVFYSLSELVKGDGFDF